MVDEIVLMKERKTRLERIQTRQQSLLLLLSLSAHSHQDILPIKTFSLFLSFTDILLLLLLGLILSREKFTFPDLTQLYKYIISFNLSSENQQINRYPSDFQEYLK